MLCTLQAAASLHTVTGQLTFAGLQAYSQQHSAAHHGQARLHQILTPTRMAMDITSTAFPQEACLPALEIGMSLSPVHLRVGNALLELISSNQAQSPFQQHTVPSSATRSGDAGMEIIKVPSLNALIATIERASAACR